MAETYRNTSMPSPLSSTPSSRTHRTRTERTAEAKAPQGTPKAADGPPQPTAPQVDWTAKIKDPQQQAAARTRHAGAGANLQAEALRRQNENAEMDIIGGPNKPGQLVDLGGNPRNGTTVTIHGINDTPASTLSLGDAAKAKGQSVQTFAWDDRSRRLGDSANDLAGALRQQLTEHPNAPLTVNAYSMGGRIAAVALGRLEQEGALKGRDVRLNLVAPPLQGFSSANWAGLGAPFSRSLRSSQDMGTRSAFQRELEGVRLPNVRVTVMGGGADQTAVVDGDWQRIARDLAGGREPVILQGATHDSAVDAAARRLR